MVANPTVLASRSICATGSLLPHAFTANAIKHAYQTNLVVSPIGDPLKTGYIVTRDTESGLARGIEKIWVPYSLCAEPFGLIDGTACDPLVPTSAIVRIGAGESADALRVSASAAFVSTFAQPLLQMLKGHLAVHAIEIASSPTTRDDPQIPEGKVAYVVKFEPLWIAGRRYYLEALTFAEPYRGVRRHNHYWLELEGINENSTIDDLLTALATKHIIANPI